MNGAGTDMVTAGESDTPAEKSNTGVEHCADSQMGTLGLLQHKVRYTDATAVLVGCNAAAEDTQELLQHWAGHT